MMDTVYRVWDHDNNMWFHSSKGHSFWQRYPGWVDTHHDGRNMSVIKFHAHMADYPSQDEIMANSIRGMVKESKWTAEETGKYYSFSGTQFLITRPDGTSIEIWSPPWGELDDGKDKAACAIIAVALDTYVTK